MNLQQKITTEATPPTPWYRQTETIEEVPGQNPAGQTTERPVVSPEPQIRTHFEPSAAERILARAGALQEVQGRLLSQEQIEAIAAEIGIKPEFVSLAIEQEQAGALAQPQLTGIYETVSSESLSGVSVSEPMTRTERMYNVVASAGAIVAYGLLATLVLLMHHGPYPAWATFLWIIFLLPALLAVALGAASRSRRWGAAAGAALGAAVVAAAAASFSPDLDTIQLSEWEMQAIAVMTGSGAVLGAIGAQGRRVVSRRAAKRRRVVSRGAAKSKTL